MCLPLSARDQLGKSCQPLSSPRVSGRPRSSHASSRVKYRTRLATRQGYQLEPFRRKSSAFGPAPAPEIPSVPRQSEL